MELTVHMDGGSRGNPGPAAAGIVITDADGTPLHEAGYFLGKATNNVAEYSAFLRAISLAAAMKPQFVRFHSDSELLVKQVTGEYRVKSPDLKPLYEEAQMALLQLDGWQITHVRREGNTRSDELANKAMDARRDVIVHDSVGFVPRLTRPDDGSNASDEPAPCSHWRVGVVGTPPAGECPAKLRAGHRFLFKETTPAGCCIHVAAAALELITDEHTPRRPLHTACDHCGVALELIPVD